jgi:transposase
MKYVGADLHKKTISICVMVKVAGRRKVIGRERFACQDTERIRGYFQELGRFQVVVEATASYEWFFLLIEDLADRVVLAHPKKLRVIAESKHKSDKVDAQILAEFLAVDMIPESYRPSPRIRQYRVLVRHRHYVQGRITSVKCKLRNKVAHYNADIAALFTHEGEKYLAELAMSHADRFEVQALWEQLELFSKQLAEVDAELRKFAETAPAAEREARAVLKSMPEMGPVTIDVVLSELGDWRRFSGSKRVVAYAGLDPGSRTSDGKGKQLHIAKDGSRLLRWALVQAAWRLAGKYRRWRSMQERLEKNTGSKKKAIVGVARRLLCVMFSMLRSGQGYRHAVTPTTSQIP